MKLEEIFKLIDAGYTKEEIQALESHAATAATAAPAAPAAPVAPAAPADPEIPAAPEAPAPADNTAQLIAALTSQVSSLTQTIQRSNLLNANQPAQDPDSVESILANIISPTYKKEEK